MARALDAFLRAGLGGNLSPAEARRAARRAAAAWADDLLAGYREDPARLLSPLGDATSADAVALRSLPFVSTCRHHLLPFHGAVHIAYLPSGRITGLSRLAAVVRALSRRLQLQERLGREILEAIQTALAPRAAACVVEAAHLCMLARGGRPHGGTVVTAAYSGGWARDARGRAEALALLGFGQGQPAARGRRPALHTRR